LFLKLKLKGNGDFNQSTIMAKTTSSSFFLIKKEKEKKVMPLARGKLEREEK
jgi:hypothetical protein